LILILATTQLSKISSVSAQSGPKNSNTVDEFDMLAQSRTGAEKMPTELDTSLKPTEFDEMEAWLKENVSVNPRRL
jgi:hypothetical protein